MTEELTKVIKFKGTMREIADIVEEVITVANNHDPRYNDTWQQMRPIDIMVMIKEKLTRIDNMPNDVDKIEELIDSIVYSFFELWHLKQRNKEFKYPSREDKTKRDHHE